jgi:hypothetical protein
MPLIAGHSHQNSRMVLGGINMTRGSFYGHAGPNIDCIHDVDAPRPQGVEGQSIGHRLVGTNNIDGGDSHETTSPLNKAGHVNVLSIKSPAV